MTDADMTNAGPRRRFLRSALAGVIAAGCAATGKSTGGPGTAPRGGDEAEVTPGEDLMQEHGLLERVLLVYDEAVRRIARSEALDAALVVRSARIVRAFVEDYHEKQEEDLVFPRLETARREVGLVAVLRAQHESGRRVTDEIVRLAANGPGIELSRALETFNRMYRPHAAREETVLFPAFRAVVGRSGYAELGEEFEEREHRKFGNEGFQSFVGQVAEIENALGIDDLARFTPSS